MASSTSEQEVNEHGGDIRAQAGPATATRLILGFRERINQGDLGMLPVLLGLIIIWTFFQLQESTFLSPRNLSNLVLQIAVIGTIAIGVVLVLLLGEIDLSVGSVAGATAAVLGVLVAVHDWPWWLAIVVMLLVAAAIGTLQGLGSAAAGIPSFVITLAGLLAWLGLQLRVLGSEGTLLVADPNIKNLTTTYLPVPVGWTLAALAVATYTVIQTLKYRRRRRARVPVAPTTHVAARIVIVAAFVVAAVAVLNTWRGVPSAGLILMGLVIAFAWLTTGTTFGHHIYAIGGNAEAARRAGIQVTRIRVTVFALCSLLAGVGGLLAVSRAGAVSTQTGGGTLLLEAIAAAVIGGTSLFGGRGSVWAALVGALMIGSVSNGLDLTGQPPDVKYMVQGAILALAVGVDAVARRRRGAYSAYY